MPGGALLWDTLGAVRALLVIKPVPVPGLGGDPVPHITRRLAAAGITCDVTPTRPDRPAYDLVRAALTAPVPPEMVIAAGGDGTHGPAGAALAGSNVPLALLSLGTFNNFARSLGIPREIDAALDIIAAGHRRTMDAGRVNGRVFFEVAGAGWDATLFPLGERLKRGDITGMLAAARGALGFRADEVTLLLDRTRRVSSRTPTVVVANGPYFGSSFAVAPTARLDDGLLSVTLFEGLSRPELLAYFAVVAEGQVRPDPRIVTHRAARIEVLSPQGLPAHADGEPLGPLASPFEVVPSAITVIAPPVSAQAQSATLRWSIPRPAQPADTSGASNAPAGPEARQDAPPESGDSPRPRPASQTLRWKAPRREP